MNNEHIVRILRIIAFLLCSILLMEVIIFGGITAFASAENVFIPSEAQLNVRLRGVGSLESAPNVGSFLTEFIPIPSGATHLYIKSPYLMNTSADSKLGLSMTATYPITLSVANIRNGLIWTYEDGVYCIDLFNYISGSISTANYLVFNWYFDATEGITNVTLNEVSQFQMNFTGIFDEPTDNYSVFDFLGAFTQNIPSIFSNLTSLIYNDGLTTIGVCLVSVCGCGVTFGIISLLVKVFRRGK